MGNGTLSVWVWGDKFLYLTIGHAQIGGGARENERKTDANSATDCPWLQAGDDNNEREFFADSTENVDSKEIAHLELRFANDARPVSGTLQSDGILQIALSDGRVATLECAMDEELAWLEGAHDAQWELHGSRQESGPVPLEIEIADGRGLIWESAQSESLAVIVRKREQSLFIATARGETEEAAKAAVTRARCKPDINPIYYWKQYWRAAPRVAWPDAQLQNSWNIALFRQAQLSATDAATPTRTSKFIGNVSEFFVRYRDDEIYILPAIPLHWRELSFDNILGENSFIFGADVENGATAEVRVRSERGGNLRLHPNAQTQIEREMAAGETWIWRP